MANQSARPDWSELMVRAQDGDRTAYALLLRSVTPWLRSLARKAGVTGDDVEDAVQDVLLAIHTVRQTYDPARPFPPWLAGVARHRLTDRLRRQGRRMAREIPLAPEHETFSADAANSYLEVDDQRRLHEAVAALPPGQRQAVEYLRMQELSLKEASAASGQSEAALKVAMHRAMKRLRTLLAGS
jgi:RNA polymerase sigma-70 factor (ECF subfamily)